MKKITISSFILSLLLFLDAGCSNVNLVDDLSNPASISGNIIFGSITLPNVTLKLIGHNGVAYSVQSDLIGKFTIIDAQPGSYNLIAEKKGFTFSPANYSINISGTNYTEQNFTSSAANGYLVDPWGYAWDATPRTAKTWTQADQICKDLGGRLPTVTEIYRNSAVKGTGSLVTGINEIDNQNLWTIIQWNQTSYTVVNVNDSSVSSVSSTGSVKFRCVYPDISHSAFRQNNIYGPPGDEGYRITISGRTYFIDKYDRPPLPYSAAMRECAFYHGKLPTEEILSGAVQSGLPNGTNSYIWIADQNGRSNAIDDFSITLAKWNGIDQNFDDNWSSYIVNGMMTVPRGFRCIGTDQDWTSSPKVLDSANQFEDPSLHLKTTTTDEIAATHIDAINNCFNMGGHLPNHQDLMLLAQSGLPNTSNATFWTSDYAYTDYVILVGWNGVNPGFTGYFSDNFMSMTLFNAGSYKYRCVYYPIDTTYIGPDTNGDGIEDVNQRPIVLVEKALNATDTNSPKIKIWIDKFDRDPAEFHEAIKNCYNAGGRLASRRDLVECILNGLPNGNDVWLWTSDKDWANYVEVIKWSGTGNATYVDAEATNATRAVADSTQRPYRCIWTNELR